MSALNAQSGILLSRGLTCPGLVKDDFGRSREPSQQLWSSRGEMMVAHTGAPSRGPGGKQSSRCYLKVELIPFVVELDVACGREESRMTPGLWTRVLIRVPHPRTEYRLGFMFATIQVHTHIKRCLVGQM